MKVSWRRWIRLIWERERAKGRMAVVGSCFRYSGLIVVLISKSFVKITGANSARHIVSPQGILAIILSLFLTPQYLDSYYSPCLECTSSGRFMSCNFFKARLKPCLLLSFVCIILLHYACPHPRNQQCSDLKVFEDIWHSITCIFVTSLDTLIWIFVLWFNFP